jgi:hypothetical protein
VDRIPASDSGVRRERPDVADLVVVEAKVDQVDEAGERATPTFIILVRLASGLMLLI